MKQEVTINMLDSQSSIEFICKNSDSKVEISVTVLYSQLGAAFVYVNCMISQVSNVTV